MMIPSYGRGGPQAPPEPEATPRMLGSPVSAPAAPMGAMGAASPSSAPSAPPPPVTAPTPPAPSATAGPSADDGGGFWEGVGDVAAGVGKFAAGFALPGLGQGMVKGRAARDAHESSQANMEALRQNQAMRLDKHNMDQRQAMDLEEKRSFLTALDTVNDPVSHGRAMESPAARRYFGIEEGQPAKLEEGPSGEVTVMLGTETGGWEPMMGDDGQPVVMDPGAITAIRQRVDPSYQQTAAAEAQGSMQQRLMGQLEEMSKLRMSKEITQEQWEIATQPIRQQLESLGLATDTIGATQRLASAPVAAQAAAQRAETDLADAGTAAVVSRTARQQAQFELRTQTMRENLARRGLEHDTAMAPILEGLEKVQQQRALGNEQYAQEHLDSVRQQIARMTVEQQADLLPILRDTEMSLAKQGATDAFWNENMQGIRLSIETSLLNHQETTMGMSQALEVSELEGGLNGSRKTVVFNAYMAGKTNPGLALSYFQNSSLMKFDGGSRPSRVNMEAGPGGAFMGVYDAKGDLLKVNGQDALFSRGSLESMLPSQWNKLNDYGIYNETTGQMMWADGKATTHNPDQVAKWGNEVRLLLKERYRSSGMFQMDEDTQERRDLTSAATGLAVRLLRDGQFGSSATAAEMVANASQAMWDAQKARNAAGEPDASKPIDPNMLEPFFHQWFAAKTAEAEAALGYRGAGGSGANPAGFMAQVAAGSPPPAAGGPPPAAGASPPAFGKAWSEQFPMPEGVSAGNILGGGAPTAPPIDPNNPYSR